jgi:hypothetical protein
MRCTANKRDGLQCVNMTADRRDGRCRVHPLTCTATTLGGNRCKNKPIGSVTRCPIHTTTSNATSRVLKGLLHDDILLAQAYRAFELHVSVEGVYNQQASGIDYHKRSTIINTSAFLAKVAYSCDLSESKRGVDDIRNGISMIHGVEEFDLINCHVNADNGDQSTGVIIAVGRETNTVYVAFRGSKLSMKRSWSDFNADIYTSLGPMSVHPSGVHTSCRDHTGHPILVNQSVQRLLELNIKEYDDKIVKNHDDPLETNYSVDAFLSKQLEHVTFKLPDGTQTTWDSLQHGHVVLCGHSLGGALAELCAVKLFKQANSGYDGGVYDRYTFEAITIGAIGVGNIGFYNYSQHTSITHFADRDDGFSHIVTHIPENIPERLHPKNGLHGLAYPVTWNQHPIPRDNVVYGNNDVYYGENDLGHPKSVYIDPTPDIMPVDTHEVPMEQWLSTEFLEGLPIHGQQYPSLDDWKEDRSIHTEAYLTSQFEFPTDFFRNLLKSKLKAISLWKQETLEYIGHPFARLTSQLGYKWNKIGYIDAKTEYYIDFFHPTRKIATEAIDVFNDYKSVSNSINNFHLRRHLGTYMQHHKGERYVTKLLYAINHCSSLLADQRTSKG